MILIDRYRATLEYLALAVYTAAYLTVTKLWTG